MIIARCAARAPELSPAARAPQHVTATDGGRRVLNAGRGVVFIPAL